MNQTATIHIALLDEGVEVWRPVDAEPMGSDIYLVLGPVPGDEEWEFAPGTLVRCEMRRLSGDGGRVETCLVATARVEQEDVAH